MDLRMRNTADHIEAKVKAAGAKAQEAADLTLSLAAQAGCAGGRRFHRLKRHDKTVEEMTPEFNLRRQRERRGEQ